MGFDITLVWASPADDPCRRNRDLAGALLVQFPGLSEFPLDHDLVARELGVPPREVLHHWPQIELDPDGSWLEAIITLWLDRAYIELPSVPPGSCAEALAAIRPLLETMQVRGLEVQGRETLLQEYEAQRARVEYVARMVEARAIGVRPEFRPET
jgi:hypothetical protein